MAKKPIRPVRPHPTDPALALVELTKGYWAVIDAAYADDVGRFNWSANTTASNSGGVYATTNRRHDGTRGHESLHRFIARLCGMDMRREIDHENRNGLDCRGRNLRSATKAQNQWNRHLCTRNKSGVKGVHFETHTERWRAEIWVNNKHLRLGRFDTIDEAANAVATARMQYHGVFANHGEA